jgi:hypothetical protein
MRDVGTALFCRGLLNAKMKLGTTLGQVVCMGHLSCAAWFVQHGLLTAGKMCWKQDGP